MTKCGLVKFGGMQNGWVLATLQAAVVNFGPAVPTAVAKKVLDRDFRIFNLGVWSLGIWAKLPTGQHGTKAVTFPAPFCKF